MNVMRWFVLATVGTAVTLIAMEGLSPMPDEVTVDLYESEIVGFVQTGPDICVTDKYYPNLDDTLTIISTCPDEVKDGL